MHFLPGCIYLYTELTVPLCAINHRMESVYPNIHANPKQLIFCQNTTLRLKTIYPNQANVVKYC